MQRVDNHLGHVKNFTYDVNTSLEETSEFINVGVLVLKLKSNINLTLTHVKILSQSEQMFLKKHSA